MSSNSVKSIRSLFQGAFTEGSLSKASFQTLEVLDLGAEIQSGLGISVNAVSSSEVVLVTILVDDSGSIRFKANAQTVRTGHNEVLKAMIESKQGSNILVHTCYLNGAVLFPFLPLMLIDEEERQRTGLVRYMRNPQVVDMTSANYDPNLGTPLYDQAVVTLARVLAKYREFNEAGVVARTITLLITDGADEHSTRSNAGTVRMLAEDMLGESHIIAGMGIDGGGSVDFRKVFREMGLRDEWILTPGTSAMEIRKAFRVFSQSAIRASQNALAFSKAAVSGFLAG